MKGGESMGTVYTLPVITGVSTSNWSTAAPYSSTQTNDINIITTQGIQMFTRIDTLYNNENNYGYLAAAMSVQMACWPETTQAGTQLVRIKFKSSGAFYLYYLAYGASRGSWFYLSQNDGGVTYVTLEDAPPNPVFVDGTTPLDLYANEAEAEAALNPPSTYPITYHYTNSTVSGPSEAAIGDTVTVSAVPDVDYGITDASTQILVTNNDVAVPYTWDAANNRITFTMPDPS